MRVLFMGTPIFACPTLKALVEAGFNVIGVFTQADRPKGRGQVIQSPPVKETAQSLDLTVFQPANLRKEEIGNLWSELRPDVVIVVAYGLILPSWVIHGTSLGCINLHASLLPFYRGAAPINWAIIRGEKETGVTTMIMDEGVDTGPILLQAKTQITPEDTAGSLHYKLSILGAELVVRTLNDYTKGHIRPKNQPGNVSTMAPKLDKEIGRLDWNVDNNSLFNLIRGINPYPGAFTFLDERMIRIWDAIPIKGDEEDACPGMICHLDTDSGLIVQTGNGRLALKEIQPESKKRMSIHSFMAGCRLSPIGKVFSRFPATR